MKTKVPKALYLVPVLYLGIITTFIYLQFSGSDTFTSKVSHMTAMGTVSGTPWDRGDSLSELQIFGTGIVFSFDKGNPVRIYSQDGLVHKSEPLKFIPQDSGFLVEMSQGLSLQFTQAEDNPQAVMIQVLFQEYSSIRNISLPFSIMRDFTLETAGGFPVFSIQNSRSGDVTMLSLPMGGSVDREDHRVVFPAGDEGFEAVMVEKTDGESSDPLAYWFSRNSALISQREYQDLLSGYISRALEGWRNTRFDRTAGTWQLQGEVSGISENLADALLAETLGTPAWDSLYSRVQAALEKTDPLLTRVSGPFLGDVVSRNEEYLQTERLALQEIVRKTAAGDPLVFQTPELYTLAAEHRSPSLLDDLIPLAGNLSGRELEPATAMGLFRFYLDCAEGGVSLPTFLDFITLLPEKELLPRIKAVHQGFFLESEPDLTDVRASLETGALLSRGGRILKREIYATLGRELIRSSLMLADQAGILPSRLVFEDGELRTSGELLPEDIYSLITGRSYFPREIPLRSSLGQGGWIYTAADRVSVRKQTDMIRISLTYPAGQTHYVTLQGVEPFSRLRLLGINWKSDPIFQYYYSGWYYEERTRTLYIKIRHRQPLEEIILYYDRTPQAAPAAPAPAGGSTGQEAPAAGEPAASPAP